MKKLSLLGELTPHEFMRDYWHKKPCVIRQAIPDFAPLLSRQALFDLAKRDDVEARLVTHFRQKWAMQNGPLVTLPAISKKNWTLLVQGVNLHNKAADALLRRFNFLPDARLDDLMISYATDGGGVGAHLDSYDVFLLQAQGTRRWRIGAQKDVTLQAGVPLKILQRFAPSQEFDLNPGDMLYLPPNYAHEGVALGECMTYSIGFRAPSFQELGEAFMQFMAESIELTGRYADPRMGPTSHSAEIPADMVTQVAQELNKIRFTDEDMAIFLGEYLSEPKAQIFFSPPTRPLSLEKFIVAVNQRGVQLVLASQMLYRGKFIFINGESFAVNKADRTLLARLADQRHLLGEQCCSASEDVVETLHDWYRQGWITVPK